MKAIVNNSGLNDLVPPVQLDEDTHTILEDKNTSDADVVPAIERKLRVDLCLYSGGRDSNSDGLGCDDVGVRVGRFGRILVDTSLHTTSNFSIYAVGDVIGPPALASAAQQQARRLAQQLFEKPKIEAEAAMAKRRQQELEKEGGFDQDLDAQAEDDFFKPKSPPPSSSTGIFSDDIGTSLFSGGDASIPSDAPLTLWTFPEVSSVGMSVEKAVSLQQLLPENERKPIIQGYGYFKDTARGRLSGDTDGFLKVVVRADSAFKHTILGVHIIGDGANELIQLGSVLVHNGATAEQVSNTPFAAVTLSGLYQIACDDVLLKSPLNNRRNRVVARRVPKGSNLANDSSNNNNINNNSINNNGKDDNNKKMKSNNVFDVLKKLLNV